MNKTTQKRRFSKVPRLFIMAALVALVLGIQPVPVAQAATITVNTTDDEINIDGDCSLREAIKAANTNAAVDNCTSGSTGADTINVPAGTYTFAIASTNEDANADGDLDITDTNGSLTITGAGAGSTIIEAHASAGSGDDRVFHIISGATATLEDMTIRHGNVTGDGGGIYDQGTLTINSSTISDNTASGNSGGIFNEGTFIINSSTISGNTASSSGAGGIGFSQCTGTNEINNSTVSGNAANNNGGGLGGGGSGCSVTIRYSTITDNTADTGDGGYSGGGVHVQANGTLTLVSSIVSGNHDNFDSDKDDCSSTATLNSGGYNIKGVSGNAEGCTFDNGDQTGDSVLSGAIGTLLYTLEDNGGGTNTHGLITNGAAVDAISSGTNNCGSSPFNADQRGETRPVDYGGGSKCDVGAFELKSGETPNAITLSDFTARSAAGVNGLALPLALVAVGIGGLGLVWRRRRRAVESTTNKERYQ